MLDLSLMKGIHVDPVRRTARAQGGVTWREFNRETQAHGLATTGGVISTTGIAGLTLGGGLGWLMAKHGLAMDNLLSAEVVTASGDIVRASKEENADLFWGLQGGGGNFGAVSWLEYRLHPVGTVTSGLIAYPFEQRATCSNFSGRSHQGCPTTSRSWRAAPCAQRRPDRRHPCVPLRPARRSRGCAATNQKVRHAHHGYNRPHHLRGYEYDVGRWISSWRPQLLEIQFHDGAERSCHRHNNFSVRVMPLADERPGAGAHPRRSDACRRQRDSVPPPARGLQLSGRLRVARPG